MIPLEMRKELIETGDSQMSICKQCELLSVARSTLYYRPTKASDKDLGLCRNLICFTWKTQPGEPAEWPKSSGSWGTELVAVMSGV